MHFDTFLTFSLASLSLWELFPPHPCLPEILFLHLQNSTLKSLLRETLKGESAASFSMFLRKQAQTYLIELSHFH